MASKTEEHRPVSAVATSRRTQGTEQVDGDVLDVAALWQSGQVRYESDSSAHRAHRMGGRRADANAEQIHH